MAGAPTRSPGLLLPPVWVKTEASRGAPKRVASRVGRGKSASRYLVVPTHKLPFLGREESRRLKENKRKNYQGRIILRKSYLELFMKQGVEAEG